MATESGRSLRGSVTGRRAARRSPARRRRSSNVMAVDAAEVLISGCRDDETSADAYLGRGFHGALTFHLVKAIKARRGNLTCRQLHAEAIAQIKAAGFRQTPQLSGRAANIDWPFLQPYINTEEI